jgi:hypothetical protein
MFGKKIPPNADYVAQRQLLFNHMRGLVVIGQTQITASD